MVLADSDSDEEGSIYICIYSTYGRSTRSSTAVHMSSYRGFTPDAWGALQHPNCSVKKKVRKLVCPLHLSLGSTPTFTREAPVRAQPGASVRARASAPLCRRVMPTNGAPLS